LIVGKIDFGTRLSSFLPAVFPERSVRILCEFGKWQPGLRRPQMGKGRHETCQRSDRKLVEQLVRILAEISGKTPAAAVKDDRKPLKKMRPVCRVEASKKNAHESTER
jgi:hypothetical protein